MMQSNSNSQNSSYHDESEAYMISPKNEVGKFQLQVGLVLSDLSGPSVDDKLKLLMSNLNRDKDSDLPFIVPKKGDASAKECLKKFNELYSTWKKDGCDPVMLQSTIKEEIDLCTGKYLGASDEEISARKAEYGALFSRDDIKKQQRRGDNKCCTIF